MSTKNIITYNAAANLILQRALDIMTDVQAELENLPEGKHFNVKAYSEKLAAEKGWDELFTATLVRTVVNDSDEYHSKRGRNGGVAKRTEAELAEHFAKRAEAATPALVEQPTEVTETTTEQQTTEQVEVAAEPVAEQAEASSEPAAEVTSESVEVQVTDGSPLNDLFSNAEQHESADEWLKQLSA